jgi:hypothetical protein
MNQNVTFEDIIQILTEDAYTPYGISKVLNEILKANGQKEIRSQMMYNYARNKMIVKGVSIANATLRPITKVEVAEFLTRYLNKHELVLPGKMTESKDQMELDLGI